MTGGDFSLEEVDLREGLVVISVTGNGAEKTFENEPGGHRWQRIPPNERHGKVHTSTVTVAVMPEPSQSELRLDETDLEISTTRGGGPGGQHRNKVETCVIIKHIPSGLTVRCENERSQHKNRQTALSLLRARLWEAQANAAKKSLDATRKSQVGSGMRGDKRRTIRVQDGHVKDHVTGKSWELKRYLRGDWE